nr:hypothetical protein [uncultured Porphyromonas sp.]
MIKALARAIDMHRLNKAIRLADKMHDKHGRRFYVMPLFEGSGHLIVIDRVNFRQMKAKGYIDRSTRMINLEMECFYRTPHRAGVDPIQQDTLKEKTGMYLEYCKIMRDRGKRKKR